MNAIRPQIDEIIRNEKERFWWKQAQPVLFAQGPFIFLQILTLIMNIILSITNSENLQSPTEVKLMSCFYGFVDIVCLILFFIGKKKRQPSKIFICSCLIILQSFINNFDFGDRAKFTDQDQNYTLKTVMNSFYSVTLMNTLGSNFEMTQFRRVVFFIFPVIMISSIIYGII